ncbi:hypothetical protein L5G28_07575 [Gordonia sp. HY285]|uniref:hypothetical protein n=1 Tax=Gordonia liuliyuniae TaxID=2911517 RepID=UPI001F466C22|nr:hypothetical protein [Gordonia liuliyuniae]MCF8610020.1 hypothetical protein [Gordonia liuliyuniae]
MSGIKVLRADNPLSNIVLRELADIAESHEGRQAAFKIGDGRMVHIAVTGGQP